jgi:hypothetical protein
MASGHRIRADEVSVAALGFSQGGEKWLRRLGFHQLRESSADGLAIYELEAAKSELEPRLARALGAGT